ncbi:MAG TPA: iron ABC transporter ATP-binding protein [Syntrophomonas sp.]|jgi:iron complex transport system ATP-binding protein|nr:iron ABC transporter ATP-binding protein [Syntrophomonas sp.]
MALLEVKEVAFAYEGHRTIFKDVSFSIDKGDLFTILGPNGCGKSTLLNCLARIRPLSHGQIMLQGKDMSRMSAHQVAQKIAYLPQSIYFSYGYSVREFVVMGRTPHLGMFSRPRKPDYKLVDETIAMMNLSHLANKSVNQISGGELQLVCIARAIVQQPEIILFDEPTSALDYGNQLRALRLIKNLADKDYAVIMTTHNPDHPILLGGIAGVLSRSGYMETGSVEQILQQERLSELYGTRLQIVYVNEISRVACLPESL